MKKRDYKLLRHRLLLVGFILFLLWVVYLHYDYRKNEEEENFGKTARELMDNYIKNTTRILVKNSERYFEYGIIDRSEFDHIIKKQNKTWRRYHTLEKKWKEIKLDSIEKIVLEDHEGIIYFDEKHYIYGGAQRGADLVVSMWEINQNYFDTFSKTTGVEIKTTKGIELYYFKSKNNEKKLSVYFDSKEYTQWEGKLLKKYILGSLILILLLNYILQKKQKVFEEKILEDIVLIQDSDGRRNLEIEDSIEFFKVRIALIKLGKKLYKKNNEVYRLSGELTRTSLELRELAIVDRLTGLYNKRFLHEVLEGLNKEQIDLPYHNIVMMIDLDNFKMLNDTFGHIEGDKLLKSIGDILKDMEGKWGTAFRYGGDEFLLVFKKIKYEDFLEIIYDFELAKKNITKRYLETKLGLSVGVMVLDESEEYKLEMIIKRVDDLLYEAKRNGKDQIVFKI